MKGSLFLLLIMLFFTSFLSISGQERLEFFIPEPERRSLAPENPEAPPRQFRELSLGLHLEELKSALMRDELFIYRGDRDVSFLPVREEILLETTGPHYIQRAYFQLADERVYIMSFSLNTRQMDHYSVFTAFIRRYGEPDSLSPAEAVWESEDTRVSIERPLTIKYLDKTVFERLVEEASELDRRELLRREAFLADF